MREEPQGGQPAPPTAEAVAPPAFTVRALLTDALARYAAAFWQIFLTAAVIDVAGVAVSATWARQIITYRQPDLVGAIVVFAFGIIGSSILFSVVGAGADGWIGTAIGRGIRRSFRYFVVAISVGLGFGLFGALVGLISVGMFRDSPVLLVLSLLAIGFAAGWFMSRLYIAVPATVVDELGARQSLSLAWRLTRPRAIWTRIFAAGLIQAFVVGAASLAVANLLPVGFTSLTAVGAFSTIVSALLSPFLALLVVSAYRRLVPTNASDWLAGARPNTFDAPAFGRGARIILVALLVAGAVGVIQAPEAIQTFLRQLPRFPTYPTYDPTYDPSTTTRADDLLT